MILRETLISALNSPVTTAAAKDEVSRHFQPDWKASVASNALILTGVRRCGKSTLQAQIRRGIKGNAVTLNLEDTRLYGLGPEDFATLLSILDMDHPKAAVHLDEVQEVPEWQRLMRALLDSGRRVCLTGSNANLLGREMGTKLTGRRRSPKASRCHRSLKQDAWWSICRMRGSCWCFSASFKQRVTSPPKYYAVDTGLAAANSPNPTPDLGHKLENAVLLTLRRMGAAPTFAAAPHEWECDFVTTSQAIQCCARLTPENRHRELRGLVEAAKLPGGQQGKGRELLVITLDQADALTEQGLKIRIIPSWKWLD